MQERNVWFGVNLCNGTLVACVIKEISISANKCEDYLQLQFQFGFTSNDASSCNAKHHNKHTQKLINKFLIDNRYSFEKCLSLIHLRKKKDEKKGQPGSPSVGN